MSKLRYEDTKKIACAGPNLELTLHHF